MLHMPLDRTPRSAALAAKHTIAASVEGDVQDNHAHPCKIKTFPNPPPSSTSIPPRKSSSHSRKGPPGRPPRPCNSFFIFRSVFCAIQKEKGNFMNWNQIQISRIAGYVWEGLSDAERDFYICRAKEENAQHKAKYPHYRYTPVTRSSASIKRKRKAKIEYSEDIIRCKNKATELLIMMGREKEEDSNAASRIIQVDADGAQVHIGSESPLTVLSSRDDTSAMSEDFAEKTSAEEEYRSSHLSLHFATPFTASEDDEPMTPQNPAVILTKETSLAAESLGPSSTLGLESSALSGLDSLVHPQSFQGLSAINPFNFEYRMFQPSLGEADTRFPSSLSSMSTSHESFVPTFLQRIEALEQASTDKTDHGLDFIGGTYPGNAACAHDNLDSLPYEEFLNYDAY